MRCARLVLRVSVLVVLVSSVSSSIRAQGFRVVCQNAGIIPSELTQDSDGTFYGTTAGGGAHFAGTVFKMDASCTITTIHDFAGQPSDGSNPRGGVLIAADGKLYGATAGGGSDNFGTAFKMDTDGNNYAFTSLLSPSGLCGGTGDSPWSQPVQGSDGNIYVTMSICGPLGVNGSSGGTVASVSSSTAVTSLGYWDPQGDFVDLFHRLVEGTDNALYGVAKESWQVSDHWGGVYKMPLGGGDPLPVHVFTGPDGAAPDAPLWRATDGSLWGTTTERLDKMHNLVGPGTLYRIDGAGFTSIHDFTQAEGPAGENQGLGQGADGFMYGMTIGQFGSGLDGIAFRSDLSGTFEKIAKVEHLEIGRAPYRPFYKAQDGKLWGQCPQTLFGDAVGTYYTIDTTQFIDSITPGSGPATGGTNVQIDGGGFVTGAEVKIDTEDATGEAVPDAQHITAVTPGNLIPGTLYFVKVVLPDGTRIVRDDLWMADFLDVSPTDIFHPYVEAVFRAGITAGCGGGAYCRDAPVRRDQMAVFLLKAEHGADYVPPACAGVFPDVPCPSTFANWVEQLAAEGITGGCGGGNYCPTSAVTRAQMAVFLLKTEHGSGYTPPACAGVFGDVACPSVFADWIERLYAENVTGGCSSSPLLYCPSSANTRGQMAVFLSKTFGLL
jgi:uncharacterized repeat protein (TIGR03803 family)